MSLLIIVVPFIVSFYLVFRNGVRSAQEELKDRSLMICSLFYNCSSSNHDWIRRSISRIASYASGPSMRIRNFEPWLVPSIMRPKMLLPLTSVLSFSTQTSAQNRFADRADSAAGHAWSPRRFPVVISLSTFLASGLEDRFDPVFVPEAALGLRQRPEQGASTVRS